jgi:hypothetical protein
MIYYGADTTKLTFREYWRWKPGLPFLFMALRKLRGIRTNTGAYVARPERLTPIDLATASPAHECALRPLLNQSRAMAFNMEFCYTVPMLGPFDSLAIALTSADHLTLLLIAHLERVGAGRPALPAYVFYSFHAEGYPIATSGGLVGLIGGPPEIKGVRLRNSSLEKTWTRHHKRIETEKGNLLACRSADVAQTLLRILQRSMDYNIERGVWVPFTEAEETVIRKSQQRG